MTCLNLGTKIQPDKEICSYYTNYPIPSGDFCIEMPRYPVADLYMPTWKDCQDMIFGEKKKTEESQSMLDFISVKIKYLFIIYINAEKRMKHMIGSQL